MKSLEKYNFKKILILEIPKEKCTYLIGNIVFIAVPLTPDTPNSSH